MQTASVMVNARLAIERDPLWLEFQRVLARRQVTGALVLARQLSVEEQCLPQIQRFVASQLARVRRRKLRWKIAEEWRKWAARLRLWPHRLMPCEGFTKAVI